MIGKLKRQLFGIGGVLLLGIALGGCGKNLVYVQETSLGINVGLGTEGTEKITIGYDRDVYSIVPPNGDTGDAMSLISINKAVMSGLNNIEVSEFVAGGEPALKLAMDPGAVAKLREKIYGEK